VANAMRLADLVASGLPTSSALNAMVATQINALADGDKHVREANHATPAQRPFFVPQSAMPAGAHYEDYIFSSKQCPIRADIHDFFNGLVWLQFPLTKTRINHLQAGEIAANGVRSTRGPLRDALTLFDESAALLHCPDALWQALVAKDWQKLFIDLRPLWQEAQLLVFGHAVLEKLVSPYKSVIVSVVRSSVAIDNAAVLDAHMAQWLCRAQLVPKPFAPLPLLGVPGWWAANAEPAFYADAKVFRQAAAQQPTAPQYP
jgi:Protein of unknown function (DUF3025)